MMNKAKCLKSSLDILPRLGLLDNPLQRFRNIFPERYRFGVF